MGCPQGGQSLLPHLLAASIDGTHPIHAAALPPELLERLGALATARDTNAAHVRRRPVPPLTAEQLLTVISTVYEAEEALHVISTVYEAEEALHGMHP
ncbi:hypothetical protein ACN28I_31725 [Archangium gephyra]|uniref:hypothetical protein n=1 Tax=Archangium gephyra TaxID=48 RepID=UPI003B813A8F